MMSIAPIISIGELKEICTKPEVLIFDASNHKHAREQYAHKHLQGAFFVDINTQLADIQPDVAVGGRHPLPTIADFSTTLRILGISSTSHVIVYDDSKGANAAARFWWMLKAVGHDKVQVLNGGIQAAEQFGFPMQTGINIPVPAAENYPMQQWLLPIAQMDEVEQVSQKDDYLVIDVRDAYRYNGESEPIDLIAGHIPGAENIPFTENLDAAGLFLQPDVLKERYAQITEGKSTDHIIVHCGSGVTACHTLLAMSYAGLEIPKLYVGSWSEWSRNAKEIVKHVS